MYIAIYKGQKQLHRQNDPSPYIVLGWLRYLDGENVTDLVIASPTMQLNMSVRGQEINLSFSGDGVPDNRSVTVPKSTATETALFFLKNEGLPPE